MPIKTVLLLPFFMKDPVLDEDHLRASFRLTFLSRLIYKPPLIASNKNSATHFGERSTFEEILRGLSHFDVF